MLRVLGNKLVVKILSIPNSAESANEADSSIYFAYIRVPKEEEGKLGGPVFRGTFDGGALWLRGE